MFCVKCGAELRDGAKFCPKCGAAVSGKGSAHESFQNDAPASGGDLPAAGEPQQRPHRGRGLLTLLIILLVLLCGLGGGAAWYFGVYRQNDEFAGRAGESDTDEGDDITGTGKGEEDKEGEEGGEETKEEEETEEVYQGERTPVTLNIRQVDNSKFPEVTFYASVVDENNDTVDDLDAGDFTVQEIDTAGNASEIELEEVYRVLNEDNSCIDLVLDASGSMDDYNKMEQAKNAAKSLIARMDLDHGDRAEVISFDDYVYLQQEFTNREELLTAAIDAIDVGNTTALYDALYVGLYQTYFESGAKCVIGFTDGMENGSSYTYEDVVTMAQNSGIPLFIIGIGEEYDADVLQSLAEECSGAYYSANVNDLESILTDIYLSIYEEQQDYYAFRYTSPDTDNQQEFRDIVLSTSDSTEFSGTYTKEYVPQSDISGAFAGDYMDWDYMLDFSSQREVTEADLDGLSLAQLRIARNEIFARHGRQFKDSMLNQWFYSRTWYLDIPQKYSPDDFDAISPSPLSKLEIQNTELIKDYENAIMASEDIYPNAADTLLSDYDLALSKAVLRNALAQVQGYPDTEIRRQNEELIRQAIEQEEVQY